SIVKIRAARREAAQKRPFGADHVAAQAADQPFARIRGEDRVRLHRLPRHLERIRASGDAVDRQIRNAELRESIGNQGGGLGGRIVTGADVQGQGERGVAEIRRVVAGGGGSPKGGGGG